jgi:ankyrin repeat protein
MRASQNGHAEVVTTLMDTGANLKLRNNRGSTAETLARELHIEIMLNAAAAMK